MTIKSQESLKNFKGEALKNEQNQNFTIGEAISNILLLDKMGGKMKCYILAQKFYTEKSVELDEADKALVKSAIERTETYTNIVTGQLLLLFEK